MSNRVPAIGISGPLGAGKSMAAKLLSYSVSVDYGPTAIHPFAAPLKRMIGALGVDDKYLYGTQAEKELPLDVFGGLSARYAMQTLGTEWGREHFGPFFWCAAWRATLPKGVCAIADDVRFPSEADTIFALGGCVIRLVRDLADENKPAQHASEDFTKVPYSFRVVNDKCPTILRERLLTGLNEWQASQAAANPVRVAELVS